MLNACAEAHAFAPLRFAHAVEMWYFGSLASRSPIRQAGTRTGTTIFGKNKVLFPREFKKHIPKIPHFHSTSEAKRSECVGLSACVKHGHVVQSKYCKWLPFNYVRPSIQTQTLVAYSLHDELPNCQCHFLSLSLANAL